MNLGTLKLSIILFGLSILLIPRYGQRSDPQMQVADIRMMASVGWAMAGAARSSKRTSCGPWRTAPFMLLQQPFWRS